MDRRGALAVAAVVALVVGIGAGALLFGSSSSKTSSGTSETSGAVNRKPITLPESLGGFTDIADAMAANGASAGVLQRQRAHQAKVLADTVAQYSAAFGGAGVGYRAYADSGLLRLPFVIAVRASSPGLTTQAPVIDAAFLGLATPEREIKSVGAVSCRIDWVPPTVAGHTAPASSEHVSLCQRSTGGVTVLVGSGGFAGPADLQAMADLTNAAWTAASSG